MCPLYSPYLTVISRHGPPSFKSIYNTFGPTSLGELLPATTSSLQMTYILSYPGIAFKFPVPKNASKFPTDKALVKVLHKNEPPCLATSFVIFAGNSWSEARAALGQPKLRTKIKKSKKQEKLCPEDTDQLDFAEIIPNDRVLLTFQSGNTVALTYGTFTAQDAVTLLGPPSEVYTKSDTRLNIHNGHTRSDEIDSGSLSEGISHRRHSFPNRLFICSNSRVASEYFYNYFSYGLSLLFSPSQTHTLQKILLHANLPASHCFHRFSRIQWILSPTGATNGASRKGDANQEVLTSEMNFDEIKTAIEKVSEPSGRPMIVNRGGQGSPSSSIELVSDNILTATPFGCTGNFSPSKK